MENKLQRVANRKRLLLPPAILFFTLVGLRFFVETASLQHHIIFYLGCIIFVWLLIAIFLIFKSDMKHIKDECDRRLNRINDAPIQ